MHCTALASQAHAWQKLPRPRRREKKKASKKKHQDKPATCKNLASETEQETQANSLAMRESLDSSTAAETWALLVDTGAATSVAPQGFASHLELSPAPSTFQLSTATGQAIKTYGLRQVHLQCHGLSLTVSFVIADVVTPLLGFDTILQHSLSLHVEHDLQWSLVNPAGDKPSLSRWESTFTY